MAITDHERIAITNAILELIWGLCIWNIITTTINMFNVKDGYQLQIYIVIFVIITYIIYLYNNEKLTPLHTR